MTDEEKKAIETARCIRAGIPVGTCNDDYIYLLNLIEKQQKEIEEKNDLVLHMKERLNNISFEVECMWRKIEKVENRNE